MRVGEAIVRWLEERGIDTVFGIPGVHTIELYRGLANSHIRVVTARHEQGAGFMADGFGRVRGQPGVCCLISGPGVTNAMTPIAQAAHDSVPLFVLASAVATVDLGQRTGALHHLPDQAGLLSSVTKMSATAADPAQVIPLLEETWSAMVSGRPGPAHLAIPTDVLGREAPCSTRPIQGMTPTPLEPDPGAVRAGAELLRSARRPVIIVGGGGVGAAAEVQALAEALDAPVATTGNAKGVVPEDHPLSLGTTLPFEPVQSLVTESDVVLAVGTELSEVDFLYTGRRLRIPGRVIRVDIDPGQIDRYVSAAVGIVGDARRVLSLLVATLDGVRSAGSSASARVRVARSQIRWTQEGERHIPWLDAIQAALPRDRIIAIDSTQLAYTAHHYLPAYEPRSWLAPYGFGALGTALPMAIGAKLAAPERAVLAIAGDGGILFTLPELATAVDERLPLPVVVWDNRGYGEIRDSFDRAGVPRMGTETTACDFVTIGQGFGCEAARVSSPEELSDAIAVALRRDRPTLLVVPDPVSSAVGPPHRNSSGERSYSSFTSSKWVQASSRRTDARPRS